MIKIEGLTKKYRSKARTTCVALDSIDLVLPDKGMVFVIGKSGSGKSTLLNILGGLDSFDGGDVVAFGNSLSSFSVSDYEAYRSDLVGFVFQDYHLIEELSVLDNITLLSAEQSDPADFDKIVGTVGISELLDRRPCELSGGQKQRVAIARCIIKSPKILLCDEPTGNLDKKSSTDVMELLHEISKERLVIIVSHNLGEAEIYADRIIELADGRIVGDQKRTDGYADDFSIRDGEVLLPYRSRLSEDQVEELNDRLSFGEVKRIRQNTSGFAAADEKYECHKINMAPRKIRSGNILRLFKDFLFTKKRQSIGAILMISLMFWVFAVIQSFVAFDADAALTHSLEERDPLVVVEKDYSTYPNSIYDDVGYLGKSYPLYYHTIWTVNPNGSSWDYGNRMSDELNLSEVYIHETYGLLQCDVEYLTSRFGVDGEVRLLAGSLEDSVNAGILITDYFADSYILHAEADNRKLTYEDLIGVICPAGYNFGGRVSGIIYTGYKEKYSELIDEYKAYDESTSELTREEFEDQFRSDFRYIELVDDIKINLGISYTLDDNYAQHVDFSEQTLVKMAELYVSVGGAEICATPLKYTTVQTPAHDVVFEDDEIGLPFTFYNLLFGTEYTAADVYQCDERFGQQIVFNRYEDNNPKKDLIYSKTFTIKCLTQFDPEMSESSMRYFMVSDWHPTRIYFPEPEDVGALVEYVESNEYNMVSVEQSKLLEINSTILTFHSLFAFIQILLICLIALYLVGYGFKSIRSNAYQIGVIKALGGRNPDIRRIFVTKTLVVGFIISVLSVALSVTFLGAADDILVSSIETTANISLHGLDIIKVIPSLLIFDGLILLGVVILSSLTTSLILRSIKPVEIIKAKE